MSNCANPVSWLKLEQYHLHDLSEEASQIIQEHLGGCDACSACLKTIQEDTASLPALDFSPDEHRARKTLIDIKSLLARRSVWAVAAAACLALVAGMFVLSPAKVPYTGIKFGGQNEFTMVLLRERGGVVIEDPDGFFDGDRFSAKITCAGVETGDDYAMALEWDLVIYQDDEVFFPLDNGEPLTCGNRVHLPGGFVLTGSDAPVVVCFVAGESVPGRDELSTLSPDELPVGAVCEDLPAL